MLPDISSAKELELDINNEPDKNNGSPIIGEIFFMKAQMWDSLMFVIASVLAFSREAEGHGGKQSSGSRLPRRWRDSQ
jgi:hypothetical protein